MGEAKSRCPIFPKITLVDKTFCFPVSMLGCLFKISHTALWSHLIPTMATHSRTLETTWFLCLHLLRMFIFKAHFHLLCVPRQCYFKELNVFPSLSNTCWVFLRASTNHWRNSWILNIALQNAFCSLPPLVWGGTPPPVSLKCPVYSPSRITMPLNFLPNSMIDLGKRSMGRCSFPTLLVGKWKGYLSNHQTINTNCIQTWIQFPMTMATSARLACPEIKGIPWNKEDPQ